MAIYGTYAQNGDTFSITNVSSSSDAKNPTFTYAWDCTNKNWAFRVDNSGTGATVSGAHAGETGYVSVTVTEKEDSTNHREFGDKVDTTHFPA